MGRRGPEEHFDSSGPQFPHLFIQGCHRWALRKRPAKHSMLLWSQFPALYGNLNPTSLLKNNLLNHCPSPCTRSRPVFLWIPLGRWEKGGNLILTLIGLPFDLNKRKISNYPTDNYSLQFHHRHRHQPSSRKTATDQGCTHASHYLLGDSLACDSPHWLREAKRLLKGRRRTTQEAVCH